MRRSYWSADLEQLRPLLNLLISRVVGGCRPLRSLMGMNMRWRILLAGWIRLLYLGNIGSCTAINVAYDKKVQT